MSRTIGLRGGYMPPCLARLVLTPEAWTAAGGESSSSAVEWLSQKGAEGCSVRVEHYGVELAVRISIFDIIRMAGRKRYRHAGLK